MKLMMWICFIPLPLIMAYMLINETRFKKNIVVGVTLPFEARENPEVQAALNKYKKLSLLVALLLVLSGAACAITADRWLALQNLMVWVLPCIVLPYIPYVICNKKLREIKLKEGWGRKKNESVSVNTALIPPQKWLSPVWFIIAMIISILPCMWEKNLYVLYIANAVCVLLMWLIYRFAYRNKAERVDENGELTSALSAVRKRNWGKMFLAAAYFLAIISILASVSSDEPVVLMAGTLVITVLLLAFAFAAEMNTRKAQEELCRDCGKASYLDDDDKWLWGIFYYNPDDDKLVINSRVGTNSTFNLAKPAGKLIAVLTLILVLSLPFILPITNAVGNKPPEFSLSAESLTACSGGTEYIIELKDIESAELLQELPESLVKVNGSNFPNLLKGRFSAKDIGGVSAVLDPGVPPYLLLTENDGDKFLLGSREAGEIEEIYKEIK